MKTLNFWIVTLLLALSACASDPGATSSGGAPTNTVVAAPTPTPAPTATPTPTPTPAPCKPLQSIWTTDPINTTQHPNDAPENALMGVYTGPPTNGPIYTLDLTHLTNSAPGDITYTQFDYNIGHTCYYYATIHATTYSLDGFAGCSAFDNSNTCGYCSSMGNAVANYTYNLNCNVLTITDTGTNRSVIYH